MGLIGTVKGELTQENAEDALLGSVGLGGAPNAADSYEDVTGQEIEDVAVSSFGVVGVGSSVASDEQTQDYVSDVRDTAEDEVKDSIIELLKDPYVLAAGAVALLLLTPIGPALAGGAANEVRD